MTSRRRGQRASWLLFSSILVQMQRAEARRIGRIEEMLRELPDIMPRPGWQRRAWGAIELACKRKQS